MSDALTTLRSALSPKGGLQRIPFPTESYQHQSLPLSAKRLCNVYIEELPADARSKTALLSNAGAVYYQTIGAGPVTAFDTTLIGGWYAVSGGEAFRNTEAGTVDIGAVGTPVDPLSDPTRLMTTIACSPFEVVICVPPNAFTCRHDEATLHPLTDAGNGFPGANSVTFIDGYFVFTQTGRGTTFFWSPLLSATGPYDAQSNANVEGMDNILLRAVTHNTELWLLGRAGIEVWHDIGDKDLPFRRLSGGVIPIGVAPRSVITNLDGSLFWIGADGIIYRTVNYQASRISTHAIEAIIQAGSLPDAAIGISYTIRGHVIYTVTFQDINRTFSYDCATKQWHERSSQADGSGSWLALSGARSGETNIIGDAVGRLYTLEMTASTDNGVAVLRSATLPPVWGGTHRAFCSRVEIEMEVGGPNPAGNLLLEWSDDGGWSWNGARTIPTSGALDRRTRVYTTRLGSFRQRVFRMSTHAHTTWYAVDADIVAPGASSGAIG